MWMCEVSNSVSERRHLVPRDEIPDEVDDEYYATWVSEDSREPGLYFTPWVMWDVDSEDVRLALDAARDLVQGLINGGAPERTLRVVFSTNKGFHVYMDSRVVGLTPSRDLHEKLRKFCLRILPSADASFYSKRRIVGIPNSLHRKTRLKYTPLGLDEFFESTVNSFLENAEIGGYFEGLDETVERVPNFADIWDEQRSKGAIPGSHEFKRRVSEGHWARAGVDKGRRDAAMFEYAVHCKVRGLTEDEAFILVYEANTRNRPNLEESDLRKIIGNCYNK